MKPRFRISIFLFSLCLCASVVIPSGAAEPTKVNYTEHVLPVFREKCLNCHNADKTKGGLDLSSYAKAMEGGSSGVVVKAGHPDESRLFLLAAHKSEPKMPPEGSTLSPDSLTTLRRWIEQGALENAASKATAVAKPKSEVASASIVRGRPAGAPPMPTAALPALAPATARPSAVTALAASPWAPLVAVAGPKEVVLLDADSLAPLGALPFSHGQINVLKFSRNGQLLLAGGGRGGKSGKVALWNVATGKLLIEVGDEHDAVLAADLSADQTQIALGGPAKMIRVYSTADGALVREIKKHTDWVTAIEFSPDGVLLATGDRSSGLFVWEAHTGREYFGLRGHKLAITDLSWRDDSNVLASSSEDGTIHLWEMENGGAIRQWAAHGGGAESVRYLHDGHIASCGRDRVAKFWDQAGAQKRAFEAFGDVALRVAAVHDNSRVLSGDLSGTLRVWSVADGKRLGEITTNPPSAAERLAVVQKDLSGKEAELAKVAAARDGSKSALEKATQELGPMQKAAADTANIAAVVADALAHAKPAADAANAALKGPQQSFAAREAKAKAFGEAAVKLKDAAAKSADNAELKQAVQSVEQIAAQAAADLAAAQQPLAAATAAAQAASAKLAAAQKAAADIAGPAKAAADALAAKQAAIKALTESVAANQAAADRLTSEVAMLKAAIERIKAVAVASK
jgi:Planctomycete cytochrome C/WD domain, G-beta repeat